MQSFIIVGYVRQILGRGRAATKRPILSRVNGIAILNINGADYRCIINGISKSDAVNLLENDDLVKKKVL